MITTTSPSVLTPTNRQSAGTSTRISLFIVKQIPINRDTIPRQFSPVNPQRINNTIFPIDTGLFRASLPMFRNCVVNQSYFPFRIFAAALQPDFIQVNERIRQSDYPNARSYIPGGTGSTLAKVRNPWRFARANTLTRIVFGSAFGSNSSQPVNVAPKAIRDTSQPSDASAKSMKRFNPSAHLLNILTGRRGVGIRRPLDGSTVPFPATTGRS